MEPPPLDKVPATAARKLLAISVYNLQDVKTIYYPLFRWLWHRQPIAKIGYSIFVYDLTNDVEGLLKLEESYIREGFEASAQMAVKLTLHLEWSAGLQYQMEIRNP